MLALLVAQKVGGRVILDLNIGIVFLGLYGGSVQAKLHGCRQWSTVQRCLRQKARA
jgi:hypothetical protein